MVTQDIYITEVRELCNHTCCLNEIRSFGDFLVKLDKKDKGKTKAALPARTSPNSTELTATDVPGLQKKKQSGAHFIKRNKIKIENEAWRTICLKTKAEYLKW